MLWVRMTLQISRFKSQSPQSRVICGDANFRQANGGVRPSSLYVFSDMTMFSASHAYIISAIRLENYLVDQ